MSQGTIEAGQHALGGPHQSIESITDQVAAALKNSPLDSVGKVEAMTRNNDKNGIVSG